MRFYTSVGSRKTPPDIQLLMHRIAVWYAMQGFTLRSGGAGGADTAFEAGCDSAPGTKEIYLPWAGFNGNQSPLNSPSDAAHILASRIHPGWNGLTMAARKLHARNCHQVLGQDLNNPAQIVVCWTPNGKVQGGTATAIRLATIHKITVVNLWYPKAQMYYEMVMK